MPPLALTDLSVKGLSAPEAGQKTYWDSTLKGFGARVSQGGTKSFVVMHGRNRELTTLGRYPTIRLKDARSAAKTVLAERALGKHRSTAVKFSDALDRFLKEKERTVRSKTYRDYKRLLELHWKPRFGLLDLEVPPNSLDRDLAEVVFAASVVVRKMNRAHCSEVEYLAFPFRAGCGSS